MLCSLLLSPLLFGIINKTKAFFAGRHGQPVLQLYYDLNKLRRKESIASRSSGGFLAIAPLLGCLFTVTALLLLPLGYASSPLAFTGDVIFFFYLLGTARLITVLAAMETGSSFEGMGAAREMHFSALAEGAIFAVIAFIAAVTGNSGSFQTVTELPENISLSRKNFNRIRASRYGRIVREENGKEMLLVYSMVSSAQWIYIEKIDLKKLCYHKLMKTSTLSKILKKSLKLILCYYQ